MTAPVHIFRVVIALVLSCALTILPLPQWAANFKPQWVLMFVLYLQFFLTAYCHPFLLLLLGFILDALLVTVLGEHAFALLVVVWIASRWRRRFTFYYMGQQIVVIGLLCFLYQSLLLLIESFLGYPSSFMSIAQSSLISMVLWPWMKLLGDDTLTIRYSSRLN
ncbi:MAG: rod shape-determining protein MreD [Legionella sp.]|nr:rod shape-determining protein MreD [Legionella sp.]